MTLAAIYARFSSDNQRDESIEIQVERCTQLIETKGWVKGEVYADFAMSGTSDSRPAFMRCMEDGIARKFDALIIYKYDRFARNVELSRKYKRQLKDAGIRLVSVREGESIDTPDGFLHEAIDEAFAEYYSRNLSVLIRDGMFKNAEKRKACGVRIFGYKVNSDDQFEVDPDTAPAVRHAFKAYASGQSMSEIALWMNEHGYRTTRGNLWQPNSISKLLKKDSYIGVYRFNGIVDPINGMPAIVDKGLFGEVQKIMKTNRRGRRTKSDFLLTGKIFHLVDDLPMSGTSGTGKSGKKYTYYKCKSKNGCGFQLPQSKIEELVTTTVKSFLSEESAIESMIGSVLDYAFSQPDNTPLLEKELAEVLKRRDNLVSSIAEGISPKSVKSALDDAEKRIEEIEMLIAREKFNKTQLLDEPTVRSYVEKIINNLDRNSDRVARIVKGFIDKVYVDQDCVIILFDLGEGQEEYDLQALKKIKKDEHQDVQGVRLCLLWWSIGGSNP